MFQNGMALDESPREEDFAVLEVKLEDNVESRKVVSWNKVRRGPFIYYAV